MMENNKSAKDLRIIYMGTPDFAVAPLRALVEGGYNVVAVVTMPDKPAGRGQKLQRSAVGNYATEVGLPLLQPERLKSPEFVEQLEALQVDLGIVVAFRMLPEVVWNAPRLGTFNLHASLLPQYRGAAPINWAIMNGDEKSGVTTFFLNHKIDEGAIIEQAEVLIEPEDCAGTLHDKLMERGTALVLSTVEKIASEDFTPIPQRTDLPLLPAPKIFKEDCHLDFSRSGVELLNKVRGLSPYPASWFAISDTLSVKVFTAHFEPAAPNCPTGTILTDNRSWIKIACADGYLHIDELQLSGKRRMATADLLRGFRTIADYRAI